MLAQPSSKAAALVRLSGSGRHGIGGADPKEADLSNATPDRSTFAGGSSGAILCNSQLDAGDLDGAFLCGTILPNNAKGERNSPTTDENAVR